MAQTVASRIIVKVFMIFPWWCRLTAGLRWRQSTVPCR
jgi:hypothetical protein